MVLKELTIKDGIWYRVKVTKVGEYTKDVLSYSVCFNKWDLKVNSRQIVKVYYDKKNNRNILFIKFKGDKILRSYYIDELELI